MERKVKMNFEGEIISLFSLLFSRKVKKSKLEKYFQKLKIVFKKRKLERKVKMNFEREKFPFFVFVLISLEK